MENESNKKNDSWDAGEWDSGGSTINKYFFFYNFILSSILITFIFPSSYPKILATIYIATYLLVKILILNDVFTPLKSKFSDSNSLSSKLVSLLLQNPYAFIVTICLLTTPPITGIMNSVASYKELQDSLKTSCLPFKFETKLCHKQADQYLNALLIQDQSDRLSKIDELEFDVPKPSLSDGRYFYHILLTTAMNQLKVDNPEIKNVLLELYEENHPTAKIIQASNMFIDGKMTLDESIKVLEKELSNLVEIDRRDSSLVLFWRNYFFSFKYLTANMSPADSMSHFDLTSPYEFINGAFSTLTPYELLVIAGVLFRIEDDTFDKKTSYLSYLAYSKLLLLGEEYQALAEHRMNEIKKRENFSTLVVKQIGFYALPKGISNTQLKLNGDECYFAYMQRKKSWAFDCAVEGNNPYALDLKNKREAERKAANIRFEAERRASIDRYNEQQRWNDLPIEEKAEQIGRNIGEKIDNIGDAISNSKPAKTIEGFWKGLTE